MKYSRVIGTLFILLSCFAGKRSQAQSVEILPLHPRRGDTLTIHYQASSDTIKDVRLIFTYSNLYDLPLRSSMQQLPGGTWVRKFVIPPYGVYACFYLQAGGQRIQPSANEQYEIMVYEDNGRQVKKGLLYKAYSMGAQMTDRRNVKPAQEKLLKEELKQYPDNYEAKLRLIALQMAKASESDKARWMDTGNRIIADQFNRTMPDMDALNQVTMGYLIMGEKSRLDSIREITIQRFPQAGVAKELLFGKIMASTDSTEIFNKIQQQIQLETADNMDAMRDYHEWLFKYYVIKGQSNNALKEARKSLQGLTGPYLPVQLKNIAALLADHQMGTDTAIHYTHRSMALLDSFPVGIIRYFKQTGYIRPFVEDSVKKKELSRQKASLLAIMGQLELNRSNNAVADKMAGQALAENPNEEVLRRTALIFKGTGRPKRALDNYRNILLENPLDTTVLPSLKEAYIAWKGSTEGLSDTLQAIHIERKQARIALLEKQALQKQAPSLKGFADLNGNPVSVDSLKGKILVIDFWATWCIPCMHEMPYLQKVYDAFKKDKRVAFMVTNSGANNTLEDARKWKEKVSYSFPVYMHTNPNVGDVFGFNVIPALYVIDNKGVLQYKTIGFEGPSVEETLSLQLELLLSKMQ